MTQDRVERLEAIYGKLAVNRLDLTMLMSKALRHMQSEVDKADGDNPDHRYERVPKELTVEIDRLSDEIKILDREKEQLEKVLTPCPDLLKLFDGSEKVYENFIRATNIGINRDTIVQPFLGLVTSWGVDYPIPLEPKLWTNEDGEPSPYGPEIKNGNAKWHRMFVNKKAWFFAYAVEVDTLFYYAGVSYY